MLTGGLVGVLLVLLLLLLLLPQKENAAAVRPMEELVVEKRIRSGLEFGEGNGIVWMVVCMERC